MNKKIYKSNLYYIVNQKNFTVATAKTLATAKTYKKYYEILEGEKHIIIDKYVEKK